MVCRIAIFGVFVFFCIKINAHQNIPQVQSITPVIDSIDLIKTLSVEDQTTEGDRFNNIIPPSPEIAQFQKYIDYPIDYNTGVPDISIPLYEINTGKLRLPITLTYHASGFKVDDQSGIIGLGWSLNAGGLVSRKIVNAPDENSSFPYPYRTPAYNLNQTIADDFLYIGNMFYSGPEYTAAADGEYDVFYYSCGTFSGKFLLAGNGYMNRKIMTIPYEPIKITTDCNFNSHTLINYFEITDTKGDIYRYGKSSIDGTMATEVNDEYNTYANAWFLKEIYSTDSTENIKFSYNSLQRFNHHRTDVLSYLDNQIDVCPDNFCSSGGGQLSSSYGSGTYLSKKLIKIEFNGGTIDFGYVNDVLRTMVVKDAEGNYVKKIVFEQAAYPNTLDVDLFKLTSIHTENTNGNKNEEYLFDYNESVNIPENGVYTTSGVDYWGYYNGKINNPTILPPLEIYMDNQLAPISYTDREAYDDKMQVFILKKITNPTGGTTEYEYEANEANNIKVGGLRVKKITSRSNQLDTPIVKRYKYGLNEDGNGKLLKDPYTVNAFMDMSETRPECVYYEDFTGMPTYCQQYFRKRTFSSDMFDGGNLNSGCPVFYKQVTEYIGSTDNDTDGKSVFIYEPPQLNQHYIGTHVFTDIYNEWQTNHLLSRTDYKQEGMVFDTIQTTEYGYTIRNDEPLRCSKVMLKQSNIMIHGNYISNPSPQDLWSYFYANGTPYSMFGGGPGTINMGTPEGSYQDSPGVVYNIVEYQYKTGAKHLDQVKTTIYSDDGEFVTIENYDYGDYLNDPVSKTISKSDGSTTTTYLKYPHNYNSSINNISVLLNKNIVGMPIDMRTYNGGQLISGNQIEYDSNGLPIKKICSGEEC